MKKTVAVLLMYLMVGNVSLFAWNDLGHMAVAFVAYQQLTDTARTRANALIKQNPFLKRWQAMIPAGTSNKDRDMMLFMIAATWPDQIKSDSCYAVDGAHGSGGNRPDGRPSSLNVGYADHLQHKYWHFVDKAFSTDGTGAPALPTPNAETQIDAFRTVLASDADDDLKSYDLVWLLHLVGDVHQPLHATTRVSSAAPDGDNGGNDERVCPVSPTSCAEKLHHFWDGALGSGDVTQAVAVAKTLPDAKSTLAHKLTTSDWIDESFNDAQTKVYVSPILAGNGPFKLTAAYRNAAKQEAKDRIALAGARLANILNAELE